MLVKYQPKSIISEFFIDNFFDSFFDDFAIKASNSLAYDIIESDEDYKLQLMIPGFNKKDFKIEIKDNVLFVSGERKQDNSTKFIIQQSYYGKFEKSYSLPDDVLHDKISAKYEDGVLIITVLKNMEKAKSKLIEVV